MVCCKKYDNRPSLASESTQANIAYLADCINSRQAHPRIVKIMYVR
jgi:hypothetical protein